MNIFKNLAKSAHRSDDAAKCLLFVLYYTKSLPNFCRDIIVKNCPDKLFVMIHKLAKEACEVSRKNSEVDIAEIIRATETNGTPLHAIRAKLKGNSSGWFAKKSKSEQYISDAKKILAPSQKNSAGSRMKESTSDEHEMRDVDEIKSTNRVDDLPEGGEFELGDASP